jgi:hypothetical protein
MRLMEHVWNRVPSHCLVTSQPFVDGRIDHILLLESKRLIDAVPVPTDRDKT